MSDIADKLRVMKPKADAPKPERLCGGINQMFAPGGTKRYLCCDSRGEECPYYSRKIARGTARTYCNATEEPVVRPKNIIHYLRKAS